MTNTPKTLKEGTAPELLDEDTIIAGRPTVDSWGWFPILSLTTAVGIFVEALADNAARSAVQGSDLLFWFGMAMLFLPIAWRLLSPEPARRERIALLMMLEIALYLVIYLQRPLHFTAYDEYTHWRTAQDIVASGHLFHKNPVLPVSPFYPGLEIFTTAVSSLTGFSIFVSGNLIIVIGVAGLVSVLALYLFYEHLSHSARTAGIAALLYMANPNYLFFTLGFDYESLAISLVAVVLFILALRCFAPALRHRGLTLLACLGIGAVVVTHHVTSYVLVAFLLLWTVISFLQSRFYKDQVGPGGAALIGLVLIVVWTKYTGDIAIGYLSPHAKDMVSEIGRILTHQTAARKLFVSSTGYQGPLWDRVIAPASTALIVLGLPFGLLQIWRHHRANAAALALTGGAFAYPISQALHLTESGAETSVRANGFLFFGVAFVLAIGATEFWLSRVPSYRRSAIIMSVVSVIIIGQLSLTNPAWDRLPGPYLVSADDRSIEPEGITAAQWAHSYLGPGHMIGTDRVNTQLMMTYGGQLVDTPVAGEPAPVGPVISSLQFDSTDEAILRLDQIQYLVVDRRLSTGLPWVAYFDDEQRYTQPIDPAALAKFDGIKNVSRVFDGGNIIIYDVEAITNGSPTTSIPNTHRISCLSPCPGS
jgi:hypothetical protein